MQQWEYQFVSVSLPEVLMVNFEKLPKPRPKFVEYSNKLGSDGWELVIHWEAVFIFKRPVTTGGLIP